MAVPTYQSVGTGTIVTGPNLTITKPSGVAVGDLLVAFVGYSSGTARTINTLSGWTYIQGTSENNGMYAFYREATSADVSASNYTFAASAGVPSMSGAIVRLSGQAVGNEIGDSETDFGNVASTTLTYTTSIIPTSPESLLIMAVVALGSGAPTVTGYSTSPSATWTERADLGIELGGDDLIFGLATAPYTGTTEVTSRAFTTSGSTTANGQTSIIVAISALQNGTADVSHLAVTPTLVGPETGNTATSTVSHLAVTPTLTGPDGFSTTDGTIWTPINKT